MKIIISVLSICSVLSLSFGNPVPKAGPPVVLVPGDGGSQIEARLNKSTTVDFWCYKKSDWFTLWLSLVEMAYPQINCFVDNMRLIYDEKTRTTQNVPGVEVRQPEFGNTTGVEWLDPSYTEHYTTIGSYFYYIVKGLMSIPELNYTRNVNIRGAPYDFRKAPNENEDFVKNLKKLIEDTYELNNKSRVILIGHSMGNNYILYLLSLVTQEWKDRYIRSYVSLAAPWAGAVKPLRLMASGDNLGIRLVSPLIVRTQQQSMPSTAWLMPYDTFWNGTEVLVYSPRHNYTVNDYERFFADINFTTGWWMRQDTVGIVTRKLAHPGVETHCLHGVGVQTPDAFVYTNKTWYDSQPGVVYGDGDGTVNLRSLVACDRWVGMDPKHPVIHRNFTGVEHVALLSDKNTIGYIQKLVMS